MARLGRSRMGIRLSHLPFASGPLWGLGPPFRRIRGLLIWVRTRACLNTNVSWCYARTTTKTESRTRFLRRPDRGPSCVTATATGSLSRFKRVNCHRSSVDLLSSTRAYRAWPSVSTYACAITSASARLNPPGDAKKRGMAAYASPTPSIPINRRGFDGAGTGSPPSGFVFVRRERG
jgi:hypothetical protein